MPTVPLMLRYKPNISPFTKYYHLKSNFYIDPFYIKVKSILRNKLSQVFTFGDFIFVAPMKSNSYVLIVLMDLCDDNGIPEEFQGGINSWKYDAKNNGEFYIIGGSSDPYNQQ